MNSDRDSAGPELAPRFQAVIGQLSQLGLQTADLDEVLRAAMVAAAEALDLGEAALFVLTPDGKQLEARVGLFDGTVAGRRSVGKIRLDINTGSLPGYTILEAHTVVSTDLENDPRFHSPARAFSFPGRSAIGVPIGFNSHPSGVLMLYDRQIRNWSDEEVHFVREVATIVGLAIQRAKIEQDLRDSSARLNSSLTAGGIGSWVWDMAADVVELSDVAMKIYGVTPVTFEGTTKAWMAMVHPEDRAKFVADQSDGPVDWKDRPDEERVVFRIIRPNNGEVRWVESWGRSMVTEGKGAHRVGVVADITDRLMAERERQEMLEREQAARHEAEATRERLTFLVQVGSLLGESLELGGNLQALTELCVPYLGDICMVNLFDDDGLLTEAAACGVDPAALEDMRTLRRRRADLGGYGGVYSELAVAHEGKTVYSIMTDEDFLNSASDEEHLATFHRFNGRHIVVSPLLGRSGVLGVLAMVCHTQGRSFEDDDVTLIEEIATRTALAIDNSRLYQSRNRVARSLQAALLPPALPETVGLAIATRYEVAEADAAIGGDFYDVVGLGENIWGVVVGDVCGRGPDAAALTGLVRHTIRTAAVHETKPSVVLANTNAAVLQQIEDSRFCTAAFLRVEVVDVQSGQINIVVSSAGHPRPILVRVDGSASAIECSGTLLGVVSNPKLREVEVTLSAGDSIVLYTDGVTEARRDEELFGEQRLVSVARSLAAHPAEVIVTGIQAAVSAFRRSPRDDMAIVVLQAVAAP